MISASGFCCTAALMIDTCDDAPASVGPVMRFEPPSSLSASSTPECSNSSWGFPGCFGIETVWRPCGISALGSAAPLDPELLELDDAEPLDELESSLVEPQAATTNIATMASAASSARSAGGRVDFITSDPPQGGGWKLGAVSRRCGARCSDPGPSRPAECRSRSGPSTTRWTRSAG